MSDKSFESPVKVEVGARAEATLEIKAEVPSASLGRFVDALTDLFRPFSEARGLKADLIRLQREEVAIEVARLAREEAEIRDQQLIAPPLKVLIPLFEQASQEDLEDKFMLEAWAKLLVSACSPKSISPRFISLIGELNSRQAKLFLSVMEKDGLNNHDPSELSLMQQHHMEDRLNSLLMEKYLTGKGIIDAILPAMKGLGIALDDIEVCDIDGWHSVQIPEQPYGSEEEVWPAPGSEDTELGVFMEPEVCHGETEVYPRVQA